jgi:hypothetical protein
MTVEDRDRVTLGTLATIGIEKGKLKLKTLPKK